MKYVVIPMFLFLALASVSCRTKDIRTVEIHVLGMTDEVAVRKVGNSLLSTKLIQPGDMKFDVSRQVVTVTYDSMKLAIKNMEHAIAREGFSTHTMRDDGTMRQGVPASAIKPPATAGPPPSGPRK